MRSAKAKIHKNSKKFLGHFSSFLFLTFACNEYYIARASKFAFAQRPVSPPAQTSDSFASTHRVLRLKWLYELVGVSSPNFADTR